MHMGLKLLVWGTLLGLLVADLMEEAAAKAAAEAAARPVDNSVCDALEGQYTGELQQRMIVIGDIHGSYDGLREVLFQANVTSSADLDTTCEWQEQPETGTVVLQIGDMVDRGPGAVEAWRCLNALADTAPAGSEAVLLLGNHDLWWLKGSFHDRNEKTDTKANIMEIMQLMRVALADGKMRGSYLTNVRGLDIIFTHAGFRPEMLSAIKGYLGGDLFTTGNLVQYYNDKVSEHSNCTSLFCPYRDEIFDAGPDRGGSSIGGPLWTDFGVLEVAAEKHRLPPNIIQVVGHSIADCFRKNGAAPYAESNKCHRGLVRATASMHAICVDGGMFLGARAFLHVTADGKFLSHQQLLPSLSKGPATGEWDVVDVWDTVCA